MFHKVLFAGIILTMVGFGILFHHFSQTADLSKKYQKLGLVQSDFEYEKVEKSWGEQGLIFYQIRLPFIDTSLYADKMNIHLSDNNMNLTLKNAHVKIIEGLKNLYGSEIAENLNNYVPYKDFLNQILTTMAVMGIDEFIGDISVNTVYSDAKTMRFTVDMVQENQPTLQITGTLHIPIVGAHQISDLWNGKIDSAEIKVKESLFKRYIDYAQSRKFTLPENIKNGIFQLKEKATSLRLKDVFK